MKRVEYSPEARKALLKHANMAPRIRQALLDYASGTGARRNQVIVMKGSTAKRMRVGDFRVVFDENDTSLIVAKIGPRGDVYDD